MWVVSEVAAMATDLAEFLGGALGLSLLFHMPLMAGMGITAIVTYAILMFQDRGFRPVELIISSFVLLIALCYLAEMFIVPVDWAAAALGTVKPQIPDAGALLLAVGIIGATVMPHAVYLHSGLTQGRIPAHDDREKRMVVRISNWEVLIALAAAGLVNMAMVMMASSAFHAGYPEVSEIETAYHTLTPLLGAGAAGVFLLSLIVSGISASTGSGSGCCSSMKWPPGALIRTARALPAPVVNGTGCPPGVTIRMFPCFSFASRPSTSRTVSTSVIAPGSWIRASTAWLSMSLNSRTSSFHAEPGTLRLTCRIVAVGVP
jgi:NRAMP (natural resistance-associated macrophage protein)-like metal ion transporter